MEEELCITFPRGDYYQYYFQILDEEGNSIHLSSTDKLFFSVKSDYNDCSYIFQKQLDNGIEWNEENNCYIATFEHEDTNCQKPGEYIFDITVVYDGNKPETHIGNLVLTKDVTRNEVE